jgi:hypothetical protein
MAAASNKKEDVFQWVWNIISSCNTIDQYSATSKLIKLFQAQYNDRDLIIMLKNRRMMMWDQLTTSREKQILKG